MDVLEKYIHRYYCSMYLTHLIPDLQEGRKFHEKEMGNENKKTAKAAQTDPVSISCMHASDRIILSAANMEVAAASGLVDETIDAGNLYSQYRWDNYQIDFYVDTSWDWLPWNWMDRIDNKISSVFYGISDGIWLISVLLSSGTGYIVQQTYSLDLSVIWQTTSERTFRSWRA